MNCLETDVGVDRPDGRFDHETALVRLGDDPVGAMLVIKRDRAPRPFDRREFAARILKDVAMIVSAKAGNDDSGFVRILADRNRRVDRNDDPAHRRQPYLAALPRSGRASTALLGRPRAARR